MTTTTRRTVSSAARRIAAVAVLATLGAGLAWAQTPAPESTRLVGNWRGSFVTDGPSGSMALDIAMEGETWKVDNSMEADGVPPKSDVREWKVEGTSFTWAQTFGDYDVAFRGVLEGDTINGSLEAYQGGSLVGTGTFSLTKQSE
jgi:hypothetical protein